MAKIKRRTHPSKVLKMEDDVMEVADETEASDPSVPEQYVLRKGDKFIPHDPSKDSVDLDHYYVSTGDQPNEAALGEVFIVGTSVWHDSSKGEVFVFAGKNAAGEDVWERSFTHPHWVIDLTEGEDKGSVLGRIVNKFDDRNAEAATKTKEKMAELEPEEDVSFGQILEELEGKPEESE